MMTQKHDGNTKKVKNIRGRNGLTRFPGICEAAARLGVTRNHLYFVLTGARRSPRCLDGYRELAKELKS